METDRKTKSFSLESPEPETHSTTRSASTAISSVTDLRNMDDCSFADLLNRASKPEFSKRNNNIGESTDGACAASLSSSLENKSSSDDTSQTTTRLDSINVLTDACLSTTANSNELESSTAIATETTTGASKKIDFIYGILKKEADRDVSRSDMAHDTHFEQRKLGKSASHESCQSKSNPLFGRHHSVYSPGTGVDMESLNVSRQFMPDSIRSGRRSPGATGTFRRHQESRDQRGLNRSYSSSATGNWPSSHNYAERLIGGSIDPNLTLDDSSSDPHQRMARVLNSDNYQSFRRSLGRDSQKSDGGVELTNEKEPVEMKQFTGGAFASSESLAAGYHGGKKPRSSSQRGHNNRAEKGLSDDYVGRLPAADDRMTRSDMGFAISGIKSPPRFSTKPLRRKRTQQEEPPLLAEQLNGFRGRDDLNDLLVYIEGADALKKSQADQQIKKTKKKPSSEGGSSGANNNNNNNNNNSGISPGGNTTTKNEKVRRSTEGDDGTSAFAALKSSNAAGGGALSYKHRSTDSLGLSFNEDDRRPFVAPVGKSTSSDDGMGDGGRIFRNDPSVRTTAAAMAMDSSMDNDAFVAMRMQMEEMKEAADNMAGVQAATLGDDEQFIPVTNKKQKKNKSDQFRNSNTLGRYGRTTRGRPGVGGDSMTMAATKRSVTPPAREMANSSGRRRRNSFDYSRVNNNSNVDRVTSAELKRSPADSKMTPTVGSAAATILTPPKDTSAFVKADSVDAAPLSIATIGLDETADSSKPSYANVAAAHRHYFHSPPNLGDFVTRGSSGGSGSHKSKFTTKRSAIRSRDNRTTRDDGSGHRSSSETRQTRQTSSLNASRSSSPINVPTAVATNLANASSPDLKTFMGDYRPSTAHANRVSYASIAAEKRYAAKPMVTTNLESAGAQPTAPLAHDTPTMVAEEKGEETTTAAESIVQGSEPKKHDDKDDGQNDESQPMESKMMSAAANPNSGGGGGGENVRKCVTDTAVNTEPTVVIPSSSTTATMATSSNLGGNAFIFEQIPSTSEVHQVIIRKAGDRSSCSGVFDLPPQLSSPRGNSNTGSTMSKNDSVDSRIMINPSASTSTSTSTATTNRERRNSCPVQFLDKAGATFDPKALTASGLTFVYGDEEVLAIQDALERSTNVVLPAATTTTSSSVNANGGEERTNQSAAAAVAIGDGGNVVLESMSKCVEPKMVHQQQRISNIEEAAAANQMPVRVLRDMEEYASRAWTEFTRDATSAIYYNNNTSDNR